MIGQRYIRELNRVLSVVADLRLLSDCVLLASVVQSCRQTIFFSGFSDQTRVVELAIDCGLLLVEEGGCLALSPIGEKLIRLNPRRYYELTDSQAPLLFEVVVRNGPLRGLARELAAQLVWDDASGTMFLRRDILRRASRDERGCFDVLRLLGVFTQEGEVWAVAPAYGRTLAGLRGHTTTAAELQEMLDQKAAFGRAAELLCVEYERRRLRSLDAFEQARAVQRISEWDVGAGYDVESYDGPTSTAPDRHIEVKAFAGSGLRFYWTRNEYLTAQRLGPNYLIYYLESFRPRRGVEGFVPRVIVDPVRTLPSIPNVSIAPELFFVSDAADGRPSIREVTGPVGAELM